jgi:hypothetical protein
MAYYNPYSYTPNYAPTYNPGYAQNQTIQDGGFVMVASEQDAWAYPIRHGTSVTFRDEKKPYIYTKTLGFSQMDSPIFEKYRLIKETLQNAQNEPEKDTSDELPIYATKSEFGALKEEFEALKDRMDKLRKELGDE